MNTQLVRYEPKRISDIRILASPRPFSTDRIDIEYPAGKTIAEILDDLGIHPYPGVWALVTVGDRILPSEWWPYARPKPGQVITIRMVPMGGRGGKGFLNAFITIIATIIGALTFQYYLGPMVGAALATAVGAAVGGLVGQLIVSAITPPPTKKLPQGTDPTIASITGTQNTVNKFGPIPKIFGQPPRFYPLLGAEPFTEILGDDQYLRMLFVPGFGPLDTPTELMKIGETPLTEFTGVELDVRHGWPDDPPLTLFSNDISEDRFSIKLAETVTGNDYIWFQRRTRTNTDEISIDVTCPRGVFKVDSKTGQRLTHTVSLFFQWMPVGIGGWNTVADQDGDPMLKITANTSSEVRRSFRIVIPPEIKAINPSGQYDVQVTRTTVNPNNVNVSDELYWTVLRSTRYVDPITLSGLCKIALRIKASDQLNGVVDKFSIIARAILPVWNGVSWVTQTTRNPAWAYTEVLKSIYSGNERPVTDSRLHLPQIKAWADKNDAEGRTFDAIIDGRTTVKELLREIPASARSRITWHEGKYSVIWDRVQNVAVQHITPKNSRDYRGTKIFADQPHGVKVRFRNGDTTVPDPTADEWIVLDDGYSWDYNDGKGQVDAFGNTSTLPLASKFEVLDLFGVTNKDWAWKDGRYHIASGRLRPELHSMTMDVEYVRCQIGDLVRFTHDVPLFGLTSGRIKEVQVNGSNQATGITFDELVVMEAGHNYSLRIRTPEGELYPTVVTNAGETDTLTFTAAITGSVQPHQGDLATFGETGLESADMIVKEIMPAKGLSARLVLVDYAPNIHLAETGNIPDFETQISRAANVLLRVEKPSINQVISDESVLIINEDGSQSSRIVVTFTYPSAPSQNLLFQGRYRRHLTGTTWITLPYMPSDVREISFAPVDDGTTYDVAIRAIQQVNSLASEWAEVLNHTVIGKTTRPPDVETFLLENNALTWPYPNPPRDMGGFLIRRNSGNDRTWSTATPLHTVPWPASPFSIAHLSHGLQTFLIKAVDSVGNESVNPAIIVKDLGDPIFQNIILEDNHRQQGWPATITNGEIIAGDLVARPISSLFWTNDANLFWTDDAASFWHGTFWTDDAAPFWHGDGLPFWGEMFGELIYEAEIIPAYADAGSRMILDIDAAGGSYKAEYATGSDSPFWDQNEDLSFWNNDTALFWTGEPDFQLWPGQINVKHERYRIRITIPSGLEGRLIQFTILIDAPDIEEFLNDIVIAVGGTNLPLTQSYRGIKSITYGLQDDGGGAVTVKTLDKPSALVGCFDSSEAPTSGLIDAFVKGF